MSLLPRDLLRRIIVNSCAICKQLESFGDVRAERLSVGRGTFQRDPTKSLHSGVLTQWSAEEQRGTISVYRDRGDTTESDTAKLRNRGFSSQGLPEISCSVR